LDVDWQIGKYMGACGSREIKEKGLAKIIGNLSLFI